ncbi:unnamed protein product [Microthlaspi erraticum]|uniref:Uncharacterized protein n=1 Tax=Microthlaspi erraticum TaxID=1685480 RepID=A0A6D2HLV9_9BRAS|nr:unnamed protein product [Microthlaspi erraticum]
MDFIKTSSLRALIELTFQRNWNGLIWMSRKGVITKRVKTVQTALSRISANRAERLAEKRMFRVGQNRILRLKSRPKFKSSGRRITTRESNVPRSAKPRPLTRHAARAGNKPRGRATFSRTTADAPSEPGSTSRVRPRSIGQSSPVRPQRPTAIRPATTVPIVPRPQPDCPADRPDRPSERRGRPEARFEARFHIFRPGLTLSRL